jgi:hypothetical protein
VPRPRLAGRSTRCTPLSFPSPHVAIRDIRATAILLPIVSGTAAREIKFGASDKLYHQYLTVPPLSMDARLRMCATLGEAILKQPHFLVALADSGGAVSPDYDWDHKLRMLIAVAVPSCNRDEVSTLVTLTFLRTPIMRAFPVGSVTVGELERQGVLFLVPTRPAVEGTEFVVEMPLVQLEKMIGSAGGDPIIPVSLLRGISSTWVQPLNWSDFEQLHRRRATRRTVRGGVRALAESHPCLPQLLAPTRLSAGLL